MSRDILHQEGKEKILVQECKDPSPNRTGFLLHFRIRLLRAGADHHHGSCFPSNWTQIQSSNFRVEKKKASRKQVNDLSPNRTGFLLQTSCWHFKWRQVQTTATGLVVPSIELRYVASNLLVRWKKETGWHPKDLSPNRTGFLLEFYRED
jgi:hypothetical protein